MPSPSPNPSPSPSPSPSPNPNPTSTPTPTPKPTPSPKQVTPTVIPYKAHYGLEDYAWLQLNAPPTPRRLSATFHGSTGRGTRNEYADGEPRQPEL